MAVKVSDKMEEGALFEVAVVVVDNAAFEVVDDHHRELHSLLTVADCRGQTVVVAVNVAAIKAEILRWMLVDVTVVEVVALEVAEDVSTQG